MKRRLDTRRRGSRRKADRRKLQKRLEELKRMIYGGSPYGPEVFDLLDRAATGEEV